MAKKHKQFKPSKLCPDCKKERKSHTDICQNCGYDPGSHLVGGSRHNRHGDMFEQGWREPKLSSND